jgi:ATP synthase, F1 delta subunit
MLTFAAAVAQDPTMAGLIGSPRLKPDALADLFLSICEEHLDPKGHNFIRVLAANRRMLLLPAIAALYDELKARAEGTIEARLISAFQVTEEQQAHLASALKARLGREVSLTCEIDQALLGGAVIHAGDLVVDGSVRGELLRLAGALGR